MDRIYVVGEMYGGRMQKKELQEMAAAPSGMFKQMFDTLDTFFCCQFYWKRPKMIENACLGGS